MQHFPIFLAVAGRRIVVSGGGQTALAKLRLLSKTEARLTVFAADPVPELCRMAHEHPGGRLRLVPRAFGPGDGLCAVLAYAANDDAVEDARVAALARADGALVNIVDNLADSAFITPAIVDRDPVVVAIGTEGAAPVLARAIKRDLEERLPATLGLLARIGKGLRRAARVLPAGRRRRDFWARYYFDTGPEALAAAGASGARQALERLMDAQGAATRPGRVDLVGAGPGDPELLTLKARRLLDRADVVIHDRLISPAILDLARREALMIDVGKTGFGTHTAQHDINALLVDHARKGAHVVRLKSGDPAVFGRLDEELEALDAAGIDRAVVPGITAASAAVAGIGQSLTRRGRNGAVRFLTGHDTAGFAEHDWRALARPGEVAAIYMGSRAARFIQGRLLMHGADPATPVTVVANASRPDAQVLASTLAMLGADLAQAALTGPALMLYGLAPRGAAAAIHPISKEIAQ